MNLYKRWLLGTASPTAIAYHQSGATVMHYIARALHYYGQLIVLGPPANSNSPAAGVIRPQGD